MTNPTEKIANNSKKEKRTCNKKHNSPLYEMFVTQLTKMHAIRSDFALEQGIGRKEYVRDVGETWFLNPKYGKGFYWFYLLDDDTIVVSMDMEFFQDMEEQIDTVAYLTFGLFEKEMPQFCSAECAKSNCKLMGFDWSGGLYHTSLGENKRLSSSSITITPDATTRWGKLLGCDKEIIKKKIENLTKSDGVPGLPTALRGLNITHPIAPVAEVYYRAKVLECLALLMSSERQENNTRDTTQTNDRHCVNCLCEYIKNNIAENLTTKNLSEIAHVSEGKLIKAFRNVKGTTPQDFVRAERLVHAKTLLLERRHQISEVAKKSGYKNQGAFSDAFKRTYGTTPSVYRKKGGM